MKSGVDDQMWTKLGRGQNFNYRKIAVGCDARGLGGKLNNLLDRESDTN